MTDNATIESLVKRIEALEAEADIRRIQARYMFLCDTPCPEFGVVDDAQRIELILDLYTEDAVWEGVGEYYDNQFGRAVGKDELRAHFNRFWPKEQNPRLLLNAHYLTSEQIHVHGDEADGQWIHFQPWLFEDGKSLIRGSRLNNAFRKVDGVWKITRTRTENVAIVDLPDFFASSYPSESFLLKAPGTDHTNDHVYADSTAADS
ncbi:nuclear transport factor 2 family protein [Gordonia desulfuricans]|uniref:Nuclear transport factor 2 family protein n=1 Tax=Gordonia desulfuricans TaxID=89051 RepID=A0A7K3LSC2_9ACTN|nr:MULTISPECIES: nuclear transport factor 2 family protein [Gordonia]EMP13604.1 ketosteroid isomerase [Gordonia sp. NB41Y]NDK91148.1 nuclear transport factor 2 family protein [Gordonia desulfuricans]WLP88644.1 nuclear transport factor 2 family protein [Gordonia sp. NB41Y]